ncbi:hypothetical protein [Streptosporangium sp. 'caverna']|uniref:hypothetical protein n=1 Tax=Streptosporangium sp. 'caverna' TaxID=2202249 RepID=UPI000D7E1CFB|nr:hypothetical protein [Streptosporangium sp. 'caverna']AWS42554.1 hypothetical protein DKM19_15520 [Streptosporangium sp. 'caverna']
METPGVLYVVACAAPPAADLAQHDGWQVHVVTAPMGARFVDTEEPKRLTGDRVRPCTSCAPSPSAGGGALAFANSSEGGSRVDVLFVVEVR